MAKSSYLSNVLKSIKYATIDTVAEMNPVIVDMYQTNKNFIKDTMEEMKENGEKSAEKKDAIKKKIKDGYVNLKDDLRTGNFYNKDRMKKAEEESGMEMFGFDMPDFDFDINFDDPFEENDDSQDTETLTDNSVEEDNNPFIIKAMNMALGGTTRSISRSSSQSAGMVSNTLVETSKFNADIIAMSTERILNNTIAIGATLHTDLSAINTNLASVVSFTDNAFRTHIENSSTFFEAQKMQMQEQTDILKEILELQKSVYKPKERKIDYDKVNMMHIFSENGGLDLSAYKKYISQNSGGGGTLEFLLEYGPLAFSSILASPLSVPIQMMVQKAIPKALADAFESVNNTLAGSISTALVNLTQAKSGDNGGFFKFLGDIFGLKKPNLDMDLSKYEKGAVAWTGKDHKALTDVIPTWLSKIYSGITGLEEQRYDYEKGKFLSVSEIRKDHEKRYTSAVGRANLDINRELQKNINKLGLSNTEDRDQLLQDIEKIEKYNFRKMKNFNPNSTKREDNDPATYGITGPNAEKRFKIIKELYKKIPRKTMLSASHDLLSGISSYEQSVRKEEIGGDSVYNALFNGSIKEDQLKDSPIMASAKRLDTTNELLQSILDSINGLSLQRASTKKKITKSKNATLTNSSEKEEQEKTGEITIDNLDENAISDIIDNANEDRVSQQEQLSYVEGIQSKQTASGKIKAFFGGINRLMTKPLSFITEAADTFDRFAYSMFFGNGEEDEKSISAKIIKGFDNVFANISSSFSSTLNAIKDEFKKDGGTTFNGLFKAVFGVDLKQSFSDLKEALFEDKDTPLFKGMGQLIGQGFREITTDLFGNTAKSIKEFFMGTDEEDSGLKSAMKTAAQEASKQKDQKEAAKKITEEGSESVFDEGIAAQEEQKKQEKKKDKIKNMFIPNAAKGLKVTKTGLVAVSAGERIVPNTMDEASISSRVLHENSAINKFRHALGLGDVKIDSFAKGGTVGEAPEGYKPTTDKAGGVKWSDNISYKNFNKFYNALKNEDDKKYYRRLFVEQSANSFVNNAKEAGTSTIMGIKEKAKVFLDRSIEDNPAIYDEILEQINNVVNGKIGENARKGAEAAGGYFKDVGKEAKNAGKALYEAFTEEDGINDSIGDFARKFAPGEKEKKMVSDVLKNWKSLLPRTLAGGVTGGAISSILGLAGGPVLGAAIGAAVSLTTKSDAVQKWLFGDKIVNENNEVVGHTGGIISKEMSNIIEKNFPDVAKGGLIGMMSSVLPFVGFSPVTGAIIGASLGFAKNSQTIKDELFGSDTDFTKVKSFVSKQLPKMGLGAMIGAVTGPFGLTTNLILGASLGMVSETNKFKNMIFGTEDVNGKRHGGAVGFIRKSLELPLQGLKGIIEDTRETFKNDILKPIKFSAKVLTTQFENIFFWIGDKIANAFKRHIWLPIGNIIADKLVRPLEKGFGWIFKKLFGITKKAITLPFRAIAAPLRSMRIGQLKTNGRARGTASERIIERQEMVEFYQDRAKKARGPRKKYYELRAANVQNQFANSEAAKADELLVGSNAQQLQDFLLMNKSIGSRFGGRNTEKAIKQYTQGVFVETGLDEKLKAYEAQNLLKDKERRRILKLTKQGKVEEAQQIVNYSMIATKKPKEARQINELIAKAAADVKNGHELAGKAGAERDRIFKETGVDISGRAFRRMVEAELHSKGLSSNITPEDVTEGKVPKPTNPTEQFLDSIYTDVHKIADRLIARDEERKKQGKSATQDILNNRGGINYATDEAYDSNMPAVFGNPDLYTDFSTGDFLRIKRLEDIKRYEPYLQGLTGTKREEQIAKFRRIEEIYGQDVVGTTGISEKAAQTVTDAQKAGYLLNNQGTFTQDGTQYQYTENGMVKFRTNEQGELEPDTRDSETRDTQKKKKENDDTQKGILSKLTGIGTSIVDFFTGKNEKKEKKSIFSKILGVLSTGFSWFGGSKLATALKVIGGGALGAYILGKKTKVAQTDENGNTLYDDYGNIQYKTVGDYLIDGVGYVLFGKAGKGGLIGFWTGTVLPGLVTFTTDTLVPGIKDGVDWLWEKVKTAWPTFKNWVITDVLPGIWSGLDWAWDQLSGVGEKITSWVVGSLLPAVIQATPKLIKELLPNIAKGLFAALGFGMDDVDKDTPTDEEIYGKTKEEDDNLLLQKPEKTDEETMAESGNSSSSSSNTYVPYSQDIYNGNSGKVQNTGTLNKKTKPRSKEDKLKELKNSVAFKNASKEKQEKILESNILDYWDQPSGVEGYTIGELCSTPGIPVAKDATEASGKIFYSDDLLKYNYLSSKLGFEIKATDEEKKENTGVRASNLQNNTAHMIESAVINIMTKGQLSSKPLTVLSLASAGISNLSGTVTKGIPLLGKTIAGTINAQKIGEQLSIKAGQFVNNTLKATSTGSKPGNALKTAASKVNSVGLGKAGKKLENVLKKVSNDAVEATTTEEILRNASEIIDTDTAGTNKVLDALADGIANVLSKNSILDKIKAAFNTGTTIVSNTKKITNAKLKNMALKLGEKIANRCRTNFMKNKVTQISTKLANALGTGGSEILLTMATEFVLGIKNADANFRVLHPTFIEIIASAIANMLIKTLFFGFLDTETVIDDVISALESIGFDFSDLEKRRKELSEIVKLYNDAWGTDLSEYDFLMDDSIETKIAKILQDTGVTETANRAGGLALGFLGATVSGAAHTIFGTGYYTLAAIKDVVTGKESLGGAFKKEFSTLGTQVSSIFNASIDTIKNGIVDKDDAVALLQRRTNYYKNKENKQERESTKKFVENYYKQQANRMDTYNKFSFSFDKDGNIVQNQENTISNDPVAVLNNSMASINTNATSNSAKIQDTFQDITSGVLGISKSDLNGETSDYQTQAEKNRETVANLNNTWEVIGQQVDPFMTSLLSVTNKAMSTVSKNLAVSLGLADAEDENVDIIKILNDDQYLQKRAKMIQGNSILANLFGGVTGSNSNNSATQESAAIKKANNVNTGTSTNKAVSIATNAVTKDLSKSTSSGNISSYSSSSKNSATKFNSALFSVVTGGKGSGVTPTKDYIQVNPAEATFVSQKYGSYANQTFGSGNNKQKVSEAGCAPSTAVMALNSNIYHETDVDMKEALRTASGYVAGNGGVTADYFADEFSKHGFKAAYVPKSDKKQKEVMMHQLNNGRSIILMGRDTKNTSKKKSPFGPNFHYVVATGMSADGKYVYINDPESDTPNKRYDADVIFNNTDLTIVPIKTKNANNALSTKVRDQLKKLSGKAASGIIFVGDSRTVGLENAIKASITKKFVAKSGSGYAWLSKNAYNHVKTYANKYKDYAIVFNFGVNDLGNISSYINFYKKVVATYGDRVYFMSVNPVNQSKYKGTATNKRIDDFNKKYKAFAGNRYIDTCTYMRTTGFESPDGLHYSTAQYKKIYDFVVDFINQVTNKSTAAKATNTVAGAVSNASDLITSTATDDTTTETIQTATNSRKHIRSISDLISAISSILSGSYMLSTSDYNSLINGDGTDGSSGTTTINTDGISGRVSSDPNVAKIQKELVAKMYSIKGKIDYSQSGPRNPDKGSADCSSTVQWAYRKITGKDIGSWTGAQETNSNTKFIDQPHNTRAFNENKLQLGDILLYGNNANDHVEMYAGNGQVIGHGSGKGPKVRSMGVVHPGKNWSAKRLANFNDIAGKGSGIFISQKSSQWANKKIGDERVSEAGCAPAVATMAIDNTKSYNMNTAIEDAANYKAKGGGVSADYFVDTFKKQGYNCLVLTDKKKIIKALKQGNNAVLIGRDLTNKSKRRSPFGSNDHYVLATGISSNEKIIYISDPEATDPDISYKTDIVMKGVRVAIIPITLNNKDTTRVNKSLSNALSVFVGRASAVDAINSASSTVKSTSTNPVLTQCAKFQTQFMKDKKAGIKWHYRNPGKYVSEQWSQALAKNKRCCNCALLARWALKEAGLISKNTFFYGKQDGTIQWSSSSKADVEKKCDVIKIGNKTVNQLEASGDLKPGDVVTYKGMRHTNIYAGNKHWYDAGHAYCSGSGEGATFTSWYGSQKYGGNTVGYIIRKKDNVSGNLGSLSSESLDSSTTGSTGDSGSTILDQLADALALLAQGWGLTSIDDSSTENTYSDEGTGTTSSTVVTGKTAKAKIWNYLHAKGIPDNGIAGAMGNFQSESGNEFNRIQSDFTSDRTPSKAYTEQVNKGSVTKDQFIHGTPNINGKSYGPGYGLAQWTSYNRKKNLYEAAKKNKASIDDPQTSLDYLWKELQDPYYRPTLNAMKAGTSVRAVSDTFLKNFEQPGDQGDSVQQARANNGTTILKEMTGKGSGLSTSGISDSANKSITSINKSNSENNNIRDIKFESVTGKGSGLSSTYSGDNSSTSSTSMPSVSFTQTRSQVSVNSNNNSSVNTAALLNAIINLLTQEVNNTASIQSIANAIVTLVDAKANDTIDVSTKKELLNTKQQIVSLMRRQNNDNASTSLGDLISSMEAIIAQ